MFELVQIIEMRSCVSFSRESETAPERPEAMLEIRGQFVHCSLSMQLVLVRRFEGKDERSSLCTCHGPELQVDQLMI